MHLLVIEERASDLNTVLVYFTLAFDRDYFKLMSKICIVIVRCPLTRDLRRYMQMHYHVLVLYKTEQTSTPAKALHLYSLLRILLDCL